MTPEAGPALAYLSLDNRGQVVDWRSFVEEQIIECHHSNESPTLHESYTPDVALLHETYRSRLRIRGCE